MRQDGGRFGTAGVRLRSSPCIIRLEGKPLLLIMPLLAIGFWLFLIAPGLGNRRRVRSAVSGRLFAHRGLHGSDAPENSLPAFEKAVRHGYGIELDVHLTADRRLVVLHDHNVQRTCGADGIVEKMTMQQLGALCLNGTNETPPELREVLRLVGGRVPLLIEIKSETVLPSVAPALHKALSGYRGTVLIESFHPLEIGYFRGTALPHGQLSSVQRPEKGSGPTMRLLYFIQRHFLCNCISRPQFIARELAASLPPALQVLHRLFKTPLLAWTATDEAHAEEAGRQHYDGLIFEGFSPQKFDIERSNSHE